MHTSSTLARGKVTAGSDDELYSIHMHYFDRVVRAILGRTPQSLSPPSLALAYSDWLLHLALHPDKWTDLAGKASRQVYRLACITLASDDDQAACIQPLPQDKRFADPAWRQWPFNLAWQSFLLTQQWWHGATTGVRGMTKHHEEVVTFATRQCLDIFSPSNYLPTNPEILMVTAAEGGANLVRGGAKFIGDFLRELSGEKPEAAKAFTIGKDVAATPGKVVFRNHLIEVIQYAPATDKTYAEPVLIVPAWIMKYYILDLSPHNSLVRHLVERGHTVFMISWKNPDKNDRNLGMDDYLRLGPLAALDAIAAICPGKPVNTVGYCLGGTLLAIAAARLARGNDARINSITLLAAQTDFEKPGELSLFIDESQIAHLEDIMADQGYLTGEQMAGAFALLNSRDLVWSRMVRDYLLGAKEKTFDLMAWNADTTRMPYRMHSEYLKSLYLRNDLAHGLYRVDGKPVALSDIRAPMFVVGTVKDHISPWRSVFKIHLLTGAEITFLLTTGGHNAGIVSEPGHPGRSYQMATREENGPYVDPDTWLASVPRAEGSWWPAWSEWLTQHSTAHVAPPPIGAPDKGLPLLGDAPGSYVLVR